MAIFDIRELLEKVVNIGSGFRFRVQAYDQYGSGDWSSYQTFFLADNSNDSGGGDSGGGDSGGGDSGGGDSGGGDSGGGGVTRKMDTPTLTAFPGYFRLSWRDVSWADSYVMRYTKNGGVEGYVPSTVGFFYMDTSADAGDMISAQIRASNDSESWSDVVTLEMPNESAPATPVTPTVEILDTSRLRFNWQDVQYATSYELTYSLDSNTNFTTIPVSTSSYTLDVSILSGGQIHGYSSIAVKVKAINAQGDKSAYSSVTTKPLTATWSSQPTPSAQMEDGKLILEVTPVDVNEDLLFEYLWSVSNESDWIPNEATKTSQLTIDYPVIGELYTFSVSAWSHFGGQSASKTGESLQRQYRVSASTQNTAPTLTNFSVAVVGSEYVASATTEPSAAIQYRINNGAWSSRNTWRISEYLAATIYARAVRGDVVSVEQSRNVVPPAPTLLGFKYELVGSNYVASAESNGAIHYRTTDAKGDWGGVDWSTQTNYNAFDYGNEAQAKATLYGATTAIQSATATRAELVFPSGQFVSVIPGESSYFLQWTNIASEYEITINGTSLTHDTNEFTATYHRFGNAINVSVVAVDGSKRSAPITGSGVAKSKPVPHVPVVNLRSDFGGSRIWASATSFGATTIDYQCTVSGSTKNATNSEAGGVSFDKDIGQTAQVIARGGNESGYSGWSAPVSIT